MPRKGPEPLWRKESLSGKGGSHEAQYLAGYHIIIDWLENKHNDQAFGGGRRRCLAETDA